MEKTQFEKDKEKIIKVNYSIMSLAEYNTIISIRDLKLWKAGMKPNRNWKVSNVKKYFGLTGNDRQGLINQLEKIKNENNS